MSDSHSLSISQYIDGLRTGNELAAQKIWERFYDRLIRLAYRRLQASPNNKVADWDDVVQVAMAQFFQGVEEGRFPQLKDRDDLWQVLAMLVTRRAIDQMRKVGGKPEFTESILHVPGQPDNGDIWTRIQGVEPTPEFAEEMFANLSLALGELPTEAHKQVALLRLQGYSNKEIIKKMGGSGSTLDRRLSQIRKIWDAEKLA